MSCNVVLKRDIFYNLYDTTITGISPGSRIVLQNVGASDVYLFDNQDEPNLFDDCYQVIQANDFPMINGREDAGAWAYSANTDAKINVRLA